MRRRFLVALGVLALIFVLPGVPPVRNALLRFGLGFAERAGYTVDYERSGGNLLFNLQLENVTVTGPGVDAAVDRLRVGYTLPALLTGTLPLRTEVSGVRGTVEADAFGGSAQAAPTPAQPPAARRGFRIRPVLQQAELSDVALGVSGLPFNVPDARVERLEVAQTGETLSFDAALAVRDAVAEASGTVALDPWRVDATVSRADVALAAPFFEGARGGFLSGTVQADAGGVNADLELDGGVVDLVGLELTDVAGPVRVRGQKLTTDLNGRALGGPLTGTASVDFAAQHWQADVEGNAALGDALVWASQGRLSQNVVDNTLQPSGTADVSLSVGGWQTFTLSGQARGEGELLGEPLENLNVDFGFETDVGVNVSADATLGGQPFDFALTPQGEGFNLTANGTDLPLRGFEGDVAVDLTSSGDRLTGSSDVVLTGRALGRNTRLEASAVTDGEGWQVDLSGNDGQGGRLTGNVDFRNDRLTTDVRARSLALPGLAEPVNLTVEADGPLQNLPITVRADGPDGVRPLFGGVRAEADFSGEATATLADGTLGDIQGQFGPLSVSGGLNDLQYTLESTRLSGRASGQVALREGRLTRQNGRLTTDAVLGTTDLRSSGVTLPDLEADFSLTQGETLSAQLRDDAAGVDVQLQNGALTGNLRGTRVGALGETFVTSGRVAGRAARLAETLELDVRARTPGDGPGTTLQAVGDAQNTRLSVQSDNGATLAGRTLAGGLDLSGDASLAERNANLSGTLGGVDVRVDAAPDANGRFQTQATLGAAGQNFRANFESLESFSTNGTLPLAELGRALGLPLRGRVQTTLSRRGGTFTGRADVRGEAFGFPLTAEAVPQGDALGLSASSSVLGQPLTVSGTALPTTDLTAALGAYGSVRARGQYSALQLSGSGEVPEVRRAGLEVASQAWTLRGDLGRGQATLQIGLSRVTARRGPNGWALRSRLEQPATFRGLPVNLSGSLERTPAQPDGLLNGTLNFGGAPVNLNGTLRGLQISGNVPAETVQSGLLGTLDLEGNVNAFTQTYDLRPVWRRPDGSPALRVRAAGTRGDLTATVRGEGLTAQVTTGERLVWSLEADDYGLEQLPVAALQGLGGRLNGSFRAAGNGYRGALQLAVAGADVRLSGQGERVGLGLEYARGDLRADASGPLLPRTNVNLSAQVGDAAALEGSVTGTPSAPELQATLRSAAQSFGGGQLALPARRYTLSASLADSLRASLTGDGADVTLRDGAWRGPLGLPFTLRGSPHRLSGMLRGALADPTFDAALTGPTVRGPLTLDRSGLQGDLTVTPGLAALPDAEVDLEVAATPEGRWQVALGGRATLPYRDLPAALTGSLSGRGGRYGGDATLSVAGETVSVTLTGEGGNAQARAAFGGVALEPFVPATGTLTGDVRVSAGGGLRYFADLRGRGEAAGQAFDLALSADRSTGINVTGTVAGTSTTVRAPLPLETVNVRLANSETPLELALGVTLGGTLTVRGGGSLRGEPLAVLAVYTPRLGRGDLSLGFGDARFEGSLVPTAAGRAFNTSLTAPTGVLELSTPFRASLNAVQDGDALAIAALDARFGSNTLTLSGSVRPQAALQGTLTVPAAGAPLGVRLTSLETGYLAALTQGGLELRSVLSPGFRPQRARLVGSAARSRLGVALTSNLVWQEGAGFSGQADVRYRRPPRGAVRAVEGTLALAGQGELRLRGGARYAGERVLDLAARLSPVPWQDRSLRGTLRVDAPVERLLPAWFGDPLALGGTLALSGDLTAPELRGPLRLSGALAAAGNLRASREGADLTLMGRGLSASAALTTGGYRATLALTDLAAGGLAPGPRPVALSGALRASGAWGGPATAQLSDLRLTSGGSRVTGRARLDGGVSAALALDVYARDLSPNLRGRLVGPVFVSADAPLSGSLALSGFGPAGAAWRLGGDLGLRGRLADPVVELALRGRGEARGRLSARYRPRRGYLGATSTLALLGAETDLTLTRTRLGVSAAGRVRYRDFGTELTTAGNRVLFAGRDKLAGWTGFYGPERLALAGPLGSLSPQLRGRVNLRGAADLSTVRGTLTGVEAGPVALGDVGVARRGGGLRLSGEALEARVGLAADVPYTLRRLELSLPGGTQLALSGSGTRSAGTLEGRVVAAGSSLPLTARYTPEGADLSAAGRTPLGALGLQARLQNGRLAGGLSVADGGARVVEGTLGGTLAAPTLAGRLDVARGENGLRGGFRIDRDALRLDALASSPLLDAPLIVTGTGYPVAVRLAAPEGALTLTLRDGRLEPSGRLALGVGPARVALEGGAAGQALRVRLGAPAAPGLVLGTDLPTALADLAALREGVTLRGFARTSGRLVLSTQPEPNVAASGLRWRSPAGPVTLGGTARLADGPTAALTGRFVGAQGLGVPWLRGTAVPFELRAAGGRYRLLSAGDLGRLEARLGEGGNAALTGDLTLGRGRLRTDLRYAREGGPSGLLEVEALPVFSVGEAVGTLTSRLTLAETGISGNGALALAGGQVGVSGTAGWARLLPGALRAYAPAGGDALSAQLRLDRFALGDLPPLAARVPYLEAPVSGVVTFTGAQVVGQLLAPDLAVLGTPLPAQAEFNGSFADLAARASVGDSRLNLRFRRAETGPTLAGLVTLERFPLQTLPEAVVGASDLEAPVTGAVRFDLPLRDLQRGYVRVATERLVLRNTGADGSGEATEGDVALRFENGRLFVERAVFRGGGFWRAQGVLTPENLDFTLEADEADVTPLLGLVPQLAALDVGAQGSLSVRATGSAAAPEIVLRSPRLDLSVAGTRYRAVGTEASLRGETFGLRGELVGVAPVTGRFRLSGDGRVELNPFRTDGLSLRFRGSANVPTVGEVTNIRGRVYPSTSGWRLDSRGVLGRPVRVAGSLAPLDLGVTGRNLGIRAPRRFLADSSTDVDLELQGRNGLFNLSGNVFVRRAQLSLNRGGAAPGAAAEAATAEDAQVAAQETQPDTPTRTAEAANADPVDAAVASIGSAVRRSENPALARFRFDNVRLRAPQEVLFDEAFGSAELSADLTLSGTAAEPRLAGEAETLAGSIRFSGRDFSLERAVAEFDPARGALPTLDLEATTSFEKSGVLGGLQNIEIVEPPEPTFDVRLAIRGGFEEGLAGRPALDLSPTLSSDAEIQEAGTPGPRPLSETELISLLTLGRLQLDTAIGGDNSLAGTVAESALDTAVDLLVVSELQDALSEVLGVELFEIRTSAFSSILGAEGSQENFGVSVRFGGYLNDNLFASVQIGRYDDPDQAYALSNEFLLRYTAAPLELNLTGSVNFLDTTTLSAVTDFSLGLSYAITPLISLDASLETQALGEDTSLGFGVSFTW